MVTGFNFLSKRLRCYNGPSSAMYLFESKRPQKGSAPPKAAIFHLSSKASNQKDLVWLVLEVQT
jgi:hypothetical protein